MKNFKLRLAAFILALMLLVGTLTGCELLNSLTPPPDDPGVEAPGDEEGGEESGGEENKSPISLDAIPEFDGSKDYVEINRNLPFFDGSEDTSKSWELFSELDALGRCGVAMANIGTDIMPTEPREEIGHVHPSGWHSVSYDVVPGGNLYNRAHLIGFQLTGENDNEKNLITGTRNLNNEGMLPFENDIAAYMDKNPNNHVLYRVTPIFEDGEMVARGVLMEAKSVEDNGAGICFCIYVYNCQAGVVINYKTGESRLADHPHAEVITDAHDELDIIPAAADDTVTHIYLEFDADEEIIGAVVITTHTVGSLKLTIATDLLADGTVGYVKILTGSGVSADFLNSFAGLDADGAAELTLTQGAEALTGGVRDMVVWSIEGYEAYVDASENGNVYVANVSSMRFHEETCSGAVSMSEKNKLVYVGYAEDLIAAGYVACGTCDPE
jgi:DNA-entry nuclease